MANSCKSFSSIKICNFKSIRCPKLKKRAENLVFGYLDHSKRHFLWFLNDPPWAILQPTCQDHLVYSKYAIWNRSDAPNLNKKSQKLKVQFLVEKWLSLEHLLRKIFSKSQKHVFYTNWSVLSIFEKNLFGRKIFWVWPLTTLNKGNFHQGAGKSIFSC